MGRAAEKPAQAAKPLLGAVGWEPDDVQERRGVYRPPGQEGSQNLRSLLLADNKGLMLACSLWVPGAHHDLFEIEQVLGELCGLLKEAGIETEGLFLNADTGFGLEHFRAR